MSCLVGVSAKTHPQQPIDDDVDDRRTPAALFAELAAELGPFTLDVASNADNAKCERYFDRAHDGLAQSWAGDVVWCNPPYSNIGAWVSKALREVRIGGCVRAVLLLPATRTEQAWWQELIEPVRDVPRSGVRTRFLPGRPRFGTSKNPSGQGPSRCPFGCVVVVIEGDSAPSGGPTK